MKKIIFTTLILSLALAGCAKKETNETKAGLANPASVYCEEQGGKIEIREKDDGQYGVCIFDDGSECEEWEFYRLECKPGNEAKAESGRAESEGKNVETQNLTSEGTEGVVKTGNDNIKIFNIEADDNIASPVTIRGEGRAFENTLIVELRNSDHEALVKEPVAIKSNEIVEIGPFEITLNFEFNNTKEGYIAVYEQSAKDGSEHNLVEIPVKFGDETERLVED